MFARIRTTIAIFCVLFVASVDASDWVIMSQNDFGANGVIELDEVVVASWSATMDPVAGFSRSWYSASDEDGLFIGMAGQSDRTIHEANIDLMVSPMPGYTVSPMTFGQSAIPIHAVGGTLEFSGFEGAARLINDGSTGSAETDPFGPEIISPAVGTSSTAQPFVVTRRDGNAIQNPDWVVEAPIGNTPVTVTYTSQADPIQVIANEAFTVDVTVQSVPEPATGTLALFGILGLMKLRRRS